MLRNDSWLAIHRRSGDTSLGQTLTRLARLAEAAHQYEATNLLRQSSSRDATTLIEWEHLQPAVHQPRTDATGAAVDTTPRQRGAVHTEVNH
jgi:hypothetical protein